jgi:hypothetical protein
MKSVDHDETMESNPNTNTNTKTNTNKSYQIITGQINDAAKSVNVFAEALARFSAAINLLLHGVQVMHQQLLIREVLIHNAVVNHACLLNVDGTSLLLNPPNQIVNQSYHSNPNTNPNPNSIHNHISHRTAHTHPIESMKRMWKQLLEEFVLGELSLQDFVELDFLAKVDVVLVHLQRLGHIETTSTKKTQQRVVIALDLTLELLQGLGVWCLVFGVWCLVFGVWCLVFGVWCLVSDLKHENKNK